MKRAKRSPLLLMALTVLIDFTGFGVIIPLLPFWAEHLGANPVQIGLILTAYSLAQFLFLPMLGRLSDRYGRRPVILWSLLIEAGSLALTALSGTFLILLIARFVGGMGAANLGTAQAVVSDTTAPAERARGMGFIGAAIGLGFVIGPAIGGGLAALGMATPFWVAGALALVNAVMVFFLLPETRASQGPAADTRPVNRVSLMATLRQPAMARLLVINLLYTLAFTAMEAMYPLFSQRAFGWGAKQNAYIFVYVGVIMVIVQGGLIGRLAKMWGAQRLLVVGLALLAAGLLLLPFGALLAVMLIAVGVLSAGSGAVSATSSTLASLVADEESQGQTLGVIQSSGGLGRIIGPLAAGWIFALGGAGAPFVVGGLLTVLALLVAIPRLPLRRFPGQTPDQAANSADSVEAIEAI
ncbi:MAG TPA: MFS transporter [Ktedonobacterales bacterium]|nr:MFS transporter [Ktedonobacterales bacterium]